MNPQTNGESSCPCCGRHCPVDNLQCPRGRMHFGAEGGEAEQQRHKPPKINDEAVALLLKCGHHLHHGPTENLDNALSFLSADEKGELTRLLNKCVEYWNEKGEN